MVVYGDRGEQNVEMNSVLRQCRARSTAGLRCFLEIEKMSKRCAYMMGVGETKFRRSGFLTSVGIYGEPSGLRRDSKEEHVR